MENLHSLPYLYGYYRPARGQVASASALGLVGSTLGRV